MPRWIEKLSGAVQRASAAVRHREGNTGKVARLPQPTARPVLGDLRIEYTPQLDGDPDPGEVVWTWVPFEEDHTLGKDRPVVIIGRRGDVLSGVALTTKNHGYGAVEVGTGEWDSRHRGELRQGRPPARHRRSRRAPRGRDPQPAPVRRGRRRGGAHPQSGPLANRPDAATGSRHRLFRMGARQVRIGVLGCGNVGAPFVEPGRRSGKEIEARTGVQLVGLAGRRAQPVPGARDRDRPGAAHERRQRHRRRPRHRPRRRGHRRHRARPRADHHRARSRASRWSRRTRSCSPTSGSSCSRPPTGPASTCCSRPRWPVGSRSCGRCARACGVSRSRRVMGIVNGTTNYILTKMTEQGAAYEAALVEAQQLGYAERDPTADVEGFDAGAKAAIMASIASGTKVVAGHVYHEGISNISVGRHRGGPPARLRRQAARDHRPRPRDGTVAVRVHPAMVPVHHPLASVRDSFNAVFVEGGAVGSLMFYGRGAGGLPTASAVLGDVIDAAVNLAKGTHGTLGRSAGAHPPIDETMSEYLLGLEVVDEPGVLHAVTGVLAANGVSIRAAEQEGIGPEARLVFITHEAKESAVQATVQRPARPAVGAQRERAAARHRGVTTDAVRLDPRQRPGARVRRRAARRAGHRRRAVRAGEWPELPPPACSTPRLVRRGRRTRSSSPSSATTSRPTSCSRCARRLQHVPPRRRRAAGADRPPTVAGRAVPRSDPGVQGRRAAARRPAVRPRARRSGASGSRSSAPRAATPVRRRSRRCATARSRHRHPLPGRRAERRAAPADDHGRLAQRAGRGRRRHVRRLPGPREGDVQRRRVPRSDAVVGGELDQLGQGDGPDRLLRHRRPGAAPADHGLRATGNFGNVLAGWVARQMGAPIADFIVASNANDILTRFVNDGDMSMRPVCRRAARRWTSRCRPTSSGCCSR